MDTISESCLSDKVTTDNNINYAKWHIGDGTNIKIFFLTFFPFLEVLPLRAIGPRPKKYCSMNTP